MSIREKLTAKLAKLSVAAGNDAQAASCRQDDLTRKSELVGEERGSSCSSSMAGARYEKLRKLCMSYLHLQNGKQVKAGQETGNRALKCLCVCFVWLFNVYLRLYLLNTFHTF